MSADFRCDYDLVDLGANLKRLRESNAFVDVSLRCGGKCYGAHAVVLAASCAAFELELPLLLPSCGAENRTVVIDLPEKDAVGLQYVLEFIYAGQVQVPAKDVDAFVEFARDVGLRGRWRKGLGEVRPDQYPQASRTSPEINSVLQAAGVSENVASFPAIKTDENGGGTRCTCGGSFQVSRASLEHLKSCPCRGILIPNGTPPVADVQTFGPQKGSSQDEPATIEIPPARTPGSSIRQVLGSKTSTGPQLTQMDSEGVSKRSNIGGLGPPQQQQHKQPPELLMRMRGYPRLAGCNITNPQLRRDPNAWKPSKNKAAEVTDNAEHAETYKKVKGILNKLTPQKFDTLVGQVKELEITAELTDLQHVIDTVFEQACNEPAYTTAYARMCRELSTKMRVQTTDGQEVYYFRKALLKKCQREFEAERLYDENRDEKLAEIERAESEDKKKELAMNLTDNDSKMKRRYLGTIRFIGELFVMSMLNVKIMHQCVARLLSGWQQRRDENSLECLCKLLTTIGGKMDDPAQASGATKGSSQLSDHQEKMKQYFARMKAIIVEEKGNTSSRVRFMLQDVIDLRASKWVPRRAEAGPKTIDQIHKECKISKSKRMRQRALKKNFSD